MKSWRLSGQPTVMPPAVVEDRSSMSAIRKHGQMATAPALEYMKLVRKHGPREPEGPLIHAVAQSPWQLRLRARVRYVFNGSVTKTQQNSNRLSKSKNRKLSTRQATRHPNAPVLN